MPEAPRLGRPVVVVPLTMRKAGSQVHSAYSSHMCPK